MIKRLNTRKAEKEFFKNLFKQAKRRRNPFYVMFELTYRCNFSCPHCYLSGAHKEGSELKSNKIFRILEQLKASGVWQVGFTGGEPLLRKDIFDILDYARRCGLRAVLLSNGYLIDDQAANRLKKVNLHKVDITFNSLRPSVFDSLTGLKGSFGKVKSAIERLIEEGIQVTVKSTAMSQNKEDLVNIGKYARALKIPYMMDGEISPCRGGCLDWPDKFSLSALDIDRLRHKIYPEMFRPDGRRLKRFIRKRDRMFNCGAGKTSFSITPYGRMNFCLEIDYPRYNILSEGINTCWSKLKAEVDRLNNIEDFVCKDCDLLKYCSWCPGRSFMEAGNFNTCSRYLKIMAQDRREYG